MRGWGHVEGMAAEKEMVEEHFIMEKVSEDGKPVGSADFFSC